MRATVLLLPVLAGLTLGQRTTGLDQKCVPPRPMLLLTRRRSNTVVASVNGAGNLIILSTIGVPNPTVVVPVVAPTVAAPVAPVAPVAAPVPTAQTTAIPGPVGAPATLCTTVGCSVPPTLYYVGNSARTFVATTPITPVPAVPTAGSIVPLSAYITTTFPASSRLLSAGVGSLHFGGGWSGPGDAVVRGAVLIVGAMAGALFVL